MNKKQNQTNRANKKSYPLFTYFCLLLAVATMCTGMTFARYATSSSIGAQAGVAPMQCSFSIDEVSSTSFNNSDYWVNIEGLGEYAQNPPREIVFSLHNYTKAADGTKSAASGVDLQATFRFFAPKSFLENTAFQIVKKGEGNTRIALTQQYVLSDIINNVGVADSMTTNGFRDYGEYAGSPEETLEITNYGFNKDTATGKFVAVAKADLTTQNPDGTTTTESGVHIATLALSTQTREKVTYELTQTRGKEFTVDGVTANDMSAPEYYSIYEAPDMPYYCLDITLPVMTLKAEQDGSGNYLYKDNQYIFAFTILNQESFEKAATDKKVGEFFNVAGVNLYSDSGCSNVADINMNAIKVVNSFVDENGNDLATPNTKYYVVNGESETECTLSGNAVTLNGNTYYLNSDDSINLNNPNWNFFDKVENYKIANNIIKKVYSIDMRVLFTQASEA